MMGLGAGRKMREVQEIVAMQERALVATVEGKLGLLIFFYGISNVLEWKASL